MGVKQLGELCQGSVGFAGAGVFQAESIAGKSVIRAIFQDLLQRGYAGFIGHGSLLLGFERFRTNRVRTNGTAARAPISTSQFETAPTKCSREHAAITITQQPSFCLVGS